MKSSRIEFNAELPAPIEKDEGKGKWVSYGKDNLYPQFLNELYYNNPIHQGIINQKVIFAVGDGVEVEGMENDKFQKNGLSKFSVDEVIENIFFDFEIQEGYYLLFKRSTLGEKEWYVETLPFELMRPNIDLSRFYYSEDWAQRSQTLEKTGFKSYPSIHEVTNDDMECVMYVKSHSKQIKIDGTKKLTSNIFPVPSYSGCLVPIMAGIEMDWFHYAESINGWTSNTIINMNNGIPEPDERAAIESAIRESNTDRKKKGGITILYNDGKERAATIENQGGNGNDTKYLVTQEHVMQTIMIGHSTQSAALFGMSKDGAVIDSADNMVSFLRFKETYVKRRQKNVFESIAFGLNKLNNWKITVKAKDYIPSWIKAAEKPQETKEDFSASIPESVILDEFRKYGEDKSKYNFLHSQEFSGDSDEDVINGYLNSRFADVTPRQIQILGLIDKGENWMSIRSALNIPVTELAKEFMRLEKEGLVKNGKVTNQGKQNISVRQELRVVYSYELRPEISSQPKVIDGTRDFCRVLIEELNRVYTREEINQISSAVGRDVWSYRGGWYHNPDTGKNRPSCRHIWKQNVITA
jgi:hypothetical protein